MLVEVNVAGEEGKAASRRTSSARSSRAAPSACRADDDAAVRRGPEDEPAAVRRARRAAAEHGLEQLSMGTSQDYAVAVEEGATIVRIGTVLYDDARRRAGIVPHA